MGVAHHWTNICGISNVNMSYWIENLHISLGASIKRARMNMSCTYRTTCCNGLKEL